MGGAEGPGGGSCHPGPENNGDASVPGPILSPADAAALDAFIDAGWDAAAVAAQHRGRAQRLSDLLGAIGAVHDAGIDPAAAEALEDVVLLRVARLRASSLVPAAASPVAASVAELSPDDAAALDRLVDAGFDANAADAHLAQRADRQLGLLSLLDIDPGPEAEKKRRIRATLMAVQRSIEEHDDRMRLEASGGRGRRIQFADLVSVAALLLIGSAVLFSIMEGVRASGQRASCQSAMQAAGIGFGQYAASSRDALPMASASSAGTPWWDVGGRPERSNSANLFTLVRTGYSNLADLACVGNPEACVDESQAGEMDWRRFSDVSYSYRMMFGRPSPTLIQSPSAVVISDRTTMVMLRPGVLHVRVFDNSPNHGGRGQSVLLGDGSVRWMTSPVFPNGDNLWLPRSVESAVARLTGPAVAEPKPLEGTETPGGLEDHFVAP